MALDAPTPAVAEGEILCSIPRSSTIRVRVGWRLAGSRSEKASGVGAAAVPGLDAAYHQLAGTAAAPLAPVSRQSLLQARAWPQIREAQS